MIRKTAVTVHQCAEPVLKEPEAPVLHMCARSMLLFVSGLIAQTSDARNVGNKHVNRQCAGVWVFYVRSLFVYKSVALGHVKPESFPRRRQQKSQSMNNPNLCILTLKKQCVSPADHSSTMQQLVGMCRWCSSFWTAGLHQL
jgi:hypothetical protein